VRLRYGRAAGRPACETQQVLNVEGNRSSHRRPNIRFVRSAPSEVTVSDDLLHRIETGSAGMAVVGLGYVGLPVACSFARAGFRVVGLDVVHERVATINDGRCPIEGEEPGLDELIATVVGAGAFRATTDYEALAAVDVVLVAVETPVDDETKRPHYAALRGALATIGPRLRPGMLVVIESTMAPGTMAEIVGPALEEASGMRVGEDFHLVHCPERLTPRRLLKNLRTMPRVVGGTTPEAADLAVALYRHVVDADLDRADCLTAEIVKTAENAYRDVQIAFANELALACEAVRGDVWNVRRFMNKVKGREMLLPGAGVGGHCIPKDPWLLLVAARDKGFESQIIVAARAVNEGMPAHVADLTASALVRSGRAVAGSRVAILGYAYLENSDDTRNSPSRALERRLREMGADVAVHDPCVPAYAGPLDEAIRGVDCVVVMVAHDQYRSLDWPAMRRIVRTPVVVDGRNLLDDSSATSAGFYQVTVGKGVPVQPAAVRDDAGGHSFQQVTLGKGVPASALAT
jgi:UDP-N-acetyl-D-mannosaminuronic acid dehydrogenase